MSHNSVAQRAAALGALFRQICRATAEEARDLSMALAVRERARLALYCNTRIHLRDQGRAIAGACSRDDLIAEGGQAGSVLFDQIGFGRDTWGAVMRSEKPRISLAG